MSPSYLAMIALVLACAGCSKSPACNTCFTVETVSIPTGILETKISWQTATDFLDDGRYVITIRNTNGIRSFNMWQDWGPAQRAVFYRTPNDSLFVYGMAGGYMFSVAKGMPHRLVVTRNAMLRFDTHRWQYIGAIDRIENSAKLRFYDPDQQPECAVKSDDTMLPTVIYKRDIPACPHSPPGWRGYHFHPPSKQPQ